MSVEKVTACSHREDICQTTRFCRIPNPIPAIAAPLRFFMPPIIVATAPTNKAFIPTFGSSPTSNEAKIEAEAANKELKIRTRHRTNFSLQPNASKSSGLLERAVILFPSCDL